MDWLSNVKVGEVTVGDTTQRKFLWWRPRHRQEDIIKWMLKT